MYIDVETGMNELERALLQQMRAELDWSDFNPQRVTHRREALYTRLKLPRQECPLGSLETQTNALIELLRVKPHPFVKWLLAHDQAFFDRLVHEKKTGAA